ncbi:hypothetical protein QPK13_22920 [Photorhabdus tasmaniensis]
MMHKGSFILIPVLFLVHATGFAIENSKKALAQSYEAKAVADYELIRLSAFETKDTWLIDGVKKPVIKTSMTKRNFIQFDNQSDTSSLNLVIPRIAFDVIAKNGVLMDKIVSLDEDTAGNKILWIEPKSSLTISFLNDLSNTPLQTLVSVTKNKKEVIAIFGPDQGKKFTLPLDTSISVPSTSDYSQLTFLSVVKKPANTLPINIMPDSKKMDLKPLHTYQFLPSERARKLSFSEPVYVGKRNNMAGGSDYWSQDLTVFPGDGFQFTTVNKNTVRILHD